MDLTSTSRIREVIASFSPRSYVVKEGDYVVIEENREKRSLQLIRTTGHLKFGKLQCSMAPLVGATYGSIFELSNDTRQLEKVARPTMLEFFTNTTHTSKNNSELQDINEKNQQLRKNDIESMKREGKAGAEIVGALVNNSATFETKTEFSQDKYKLKKAKKYCTYISIQRPTAATVCQLFFDKNTHRVWSLRADSLSILLSLANIGAYAQVLVVESCLGVVTAAVAERLGGHGQLCAAADAERGAPLDAVQYLNFNEQQKSAICTTTLAGLLAAKQSGAPQLASTSQAAADSSTPAAGDTSVAPTHTAPTGQEAGANDTIHAASLATTTSSEAAIVAQNGHHAATDDDAAVVAMEADGVAEVPGTTGDAAMGDGVGDPDRQAGTAGTSSHPRQRRGKESGEGRRSYSASAELLSRMVNAGFSSCIIASPKLHPRAALDAVLPLLAPSAFFAVYSPWMQPLAEAMHHLQQNRLAVMLQLQESWLRDYQVLPGRSHPEMSMTGTGGYILSGIKIQTDDGRTTASGGAMQAAGSQQPGGKRQAEEGGAAGAKRFRRR